MNHLFRELAPISEEAWAQIDDDARARLATYLGGRRLVDFSGPLGWDSSAVNLGRVTEIAEPPPGTEASAAFEMGVRTVLPLAELRAPFALSRAALDAAARGDRAIDLDALDAAARAIATMENVAVFHGWPAAGIAGIAPASPHPPIRSRRRPAPRGRRRRSPRRLSASRWRAWADPTAWRWATSRGSVCSSASREASRCAST